MIAPVQVQVQSRYFPLKDIEVLFFLPYLTPLFNYAFCISVALSNTKKILNNEEGALERYIKFISLGSDVYPLDAFKVLGYDLKDKKVYQDAIDCFNELITKYIEISKE